MIYYKSYRAKESHDHVTSMTMKEEIALNQVRSSQYQIQTLEELKYRLSIIPEASKKIFEARWGLDGGAVCTHFPKLDKKLQISNSSELYQKAQKDLLNSKWLIYLDDPKSTPFEQAVNIGKLATVLVEKYFYDQTLRIDAVKMIECIHTFLKGAERDVIVLHYGLDDGNYKTLREVAPKLNISMSLVHHTEYKALTTLSYYKFHFTISQSHNMGSKTIHTKTLDTLKASLAISTGTYNSLMRAGIDTLEKLNQLTVKEIMAIDGVGRTRCEEILAIQETFRKTEL